ncbi:MAG: magnesium transporter [Thermodesulfobacteriota bacterium]|nr:magnesium transporter [Thermodesulfobacteriota bacterium]
MAAKASDIKLLKEYISKGREFYIIEMLHTLKPVEIAELIEALDEESRGKLFLLLDVDTASDVISELSDDSRDDVLDDISDTELARIVEDMDSDDAVDLVGDLHGERAQRVLAAMDPRDSSEIRDLLIYPEDTAGGIMQKEMISVAEEATINEILDQIRQQAPDVDDIHNIFVVDHPGRLKGSVPLVHLILAKPDARISQIMETDPISVPVNMDQEEVARLFKKYDSIALPVVDKGNHLLGRITVDDIVDIIDEEATEDMFMLAGADEDLLSSSILKNASTRVPWLFICWLGGVLNSFLIKGFESHLSQIIGLAAFMPIILGMGGNVGSQSVALIVRGIATGRVSTTDFLKIVVKQLGVGAILGCMYGVMLGVTTFFIYPGSPRMSFVVGLSIFNSMTIAAFIGTILPIMFFRLGKDPAVASGPFMSTAMDLVGVVAYFGIAVLLIF